MLELFMVKFYYHITGMVTFFTNLIFILVVIVVPLLLSELLYLIFGKIWQVKILKDHKFIEAILFELL